jgi:hypothetical protein
VAKKKAKKKSTARKGMGFDAAARQVAQRQGISMERARKIIASGARKASPAAKKRNPNLRKVKG